MRRQSWHRVHLESSNVCLSLFFTSQKDKISNSRMSCVLASPGVGTKKTATLKYRYPRLHYCVSRVLVTCFCELLSIWSERTKLTHTPTLGKLGEWYCLKCSFEFYKIKRRVSVVVGKKIRKRNKYRHFAKKMFWHLIWG